MGVSVRWRRARVWLLVAGSLIGSSQYGLFVGCTCGRAAIKSWDPLTHLCVLRDKGFGEPSLVCVSQGHPYCGDMSGPQVPDK